MSLALISDSTKMSRTYKRKEDARKYGYDEQSMQNALVEIKKKGLSEKRRHSCMILIAQL